MKKMLLMAALIAVCIIPVKAADPVAGAYFCIPGTDIQFTYPFNHIDFCPYVHSITTKEEMMGADTRMAGWPGKPTPVSILGREVVIRQYLISANMGYITSFKANGMPYGSASIDLLKLTTRQTEFLSYFAVGYGYDFKLHQDHFLINTAIPFENSVFEDIVNFF